VNILPSLGHEPERARDVPRSCACEWEWDQDARVYRRVLYRPGCAWHTTGKAS
jgi:hypothetical protein